MKQTALLLALLYLFLSGLMTAGAGGHAAAHEHGTDHPAQHASLICDWMCAASSFVHSATPNLNQRFNPSSENPAVYSEPSFINLSIFSLRIRPPPVTPSSQA